MKIVIVHGSPRKGNTYKATELYRFPRLYRRGTFKTQAMLVLFLLLPGIERICESTLRCFLQLRQNNHSPKCLFDPGNLFQEIEFSAERSAGILLDGFCCFAHRVFRWNHHIQVNMIWFYSYFYVFPVRIIFCYFL